jgi:hypothetical protein
MKDQKLTRRQRERQRKKTVNRVMYLSVVVAVVLIVAIGLYFSMSSRNPLGNQLDQPISAEVYSALERAAAPPYGPPDSSALSRIQAHQGSPYSMDGKPILVYVGADFCPYCASQRWPLIIALMRFGNFTGLEYTASSSNDVYPNTATFTFLHSSYSSPYLVFQAYETADRAGSPLQTVPDNYKSVLTQLGGSIPFLNFANQYVLTGSIVSNDYFFQDSPNDKNPKNWTQVINDLDSNSQAGVAIKRAANAITAYICKINGGQPFEVCGAFPIAYHTPDQSPTSSSPINIANRGTISSNPAAWAIVQYRQIAWRTNSSTAIK